MKDNLENFFKHTLEDFKDAPGDNVWDELEQRLEPKQANTLNQKWLLPLLMASLIIISTFSVVSNISLHQKTEKLSAQIQLEQHKIKDLQQDKTEFRVKYAKLENDCNPMVMSPFLQAFPLRDDDIYSIQEL